MARRTLGAGSSLLLAGLIAVVLMVVGVQPAAAATTLVVDDDGVECPSPDFSSISAAVAAASSGDTIEVCPGTYVENIILNKQLTILGAQEGVDACGRMVVDESTVIPLNPLTRTLELRTGSADSIIDGFNFVGGFRAIESTSGPIHNLELLNNRIHGFTNAGVFLNDTGLNITVDQNEIDGTSKVGGGGLFHLDTDNFDGFWFTNNCVVNGTTGTGFFVDGNRNVDAGTAGARVPRFTGNIVDANGTGVNLGTRAWGDGPIADNLVTNNRFDGLQGGPRDSLIEENDFAFNGRHGLALTSFGNMDPLRGAQENDILRNCFRRNGFVMGGAGIFFSSVQASGTISTNEAHQNNIFGNATGAQYVGFEVIDAELNWWGSPTGPTHVANPGGMGDAVVDNGNGIDYDPFLTSAAGGTPCVPTPPPSGKATGGGQVAVPGGKGNLGFNAKQENGVASGHLNYRNHVTGAHLDCTVTLVTELTATTAKFSGTCTMQSDAASFTAEVEDNAEPGRNMDVFRITYGVTTEGGVLTAGNIQIHSSAGPASAGASGAGASQFPAGATFNGVSLSGLETGLGLLIAPDGTATGGFVATLHGSSALGQPQAIEVDGRVTGGSVGADGSVMFDGTAALDMGDGSLPLLGVPFTVTAKLQSLLLTLGTAALPAAPMPAGSIAIG